MLSLCLSLQTELIFQQTVTDSKILWKHCIMCILLCECYGSAI